MGRLDGAERRYRLGLDVGAKLVRGSRVPVGTYALQVERRELALNLVIEREIELDRLACLAVVQRGARLSEVVVAVVAEVNNLAAELCLQPTGRGDLGVEEATGEKAARLLSEANDRVGNHGLAGTSARAASGPSAAWIARLKATHAAQPITLYQR